MVGSFPRSPSEERVTWTLFDKESVELIRGIWPTEDPDEGILRISFVEEVVGFLRDESGCRFIDLIPGFSLYRSWLQAPVAETPRWVEGLSTETLTWLRHNNLTTWSALSYLSWDDACSIEAFSEPIFENLVEIMIETAWELGGLDPVDVVMEENSPQEETSASAPAQNLSSAASAGVNRTSSQEPEVETALNGEPGSQEESESGAANDPVFVARAAVASNDDFGKTFGDVFPQLEENDYLLGQRLSWAPEGFRRLSLATRGVLERFGCETWREIFEYRLDDRRWQTPPAAEAMEELRELLEELTAVLVGEDVEDDAESSDAPNPIQGEVGMIESLRIVAEWGAETYPDATIEEILIFARKPDAPSEILDAVAGFLSSRPLASTPFGVTGS